MRTFIPDRDNLKQTIRFRWLPTWLTSGLLLLSLTMCTGYENLNSGQGGHGDLEAILCVLFSIASVISSRYVFNRKVLQLLIMMIVCVTIYWGIPSISRPFFLLTSPLYCEHWWDDSPTLCYSCAEAKGLNWIDISKTCGG